MGKEFTRKESVTGNKNKYCYVLSWSISKGKDCSCITVLCSDCGTVFQNIIVAGEDEGACRIPQYCPRCRELKKMRTGRAGHGKKNDQEGKEGEGAD